jgi:KipI family sensor histidine kinase inhibitor
VTEQIRPVRPFGDGAVVAELPSVPEALALAAATNDRGWDGVEDVVVGYRSVVVIVDPAVADLGAVAHELARIPALERALPPTRKVVEIPVTFDGPDLDEVASLAKTTADAVAGQLLEADLTVAFVGFLPGFAYLEGLPGALGAVPRRSTPRTAVAPGSVAIGGGFAGIYPRPSPGGWQLVGRTGFELFHPETAPFTVLHPGDTVRLRVDAGPSGATSTGAPATRPRLRSDARTTVEVRAPGLLSMVQDLGRVGVAALGVPRAGVADPFSARAANRLVGNEDGAGVLEVTALGPRLRFAGPAHVAVVGRAEANVDGRPIALDTVVPMSRGQELAVGATHHDLRCYVAVAGGFDVAPVLGSRSSDVLTGLGPGALRTGDVLGIGPATRPRGQIVRSGGGTGDGPRRLRVIAGPDALDTDLADRLCGADWEVGAASDRMGVRLRGDEPVHAGVPEMASRGMVTGAVQVPPDGGPVVLLCDHATVGGYPVAATVVQADLGVLGQLRPGDAVRFEVVGLTEAHRARAQVERALDRDVVGWFPVRSD